RRLRVYRGPRENGFRPAIDPLFRSTARAFGPRVVRVVLSGLLDDAAFGLRQIVDCAGVAPAPDPDEQPFPDTPRAAIGRVREASVLPVDGIARRLVELVSEPSTSGETTMAARYLRPGAGSSPDPLAQSDPLERPGAEETLTPSIYSCPDCGGT